MSGLKHKHLVNFYGRDGEICVGGGEIRYGNGGTELGGASDIYGGVHTQVLDAIGALLIAENRIEKYTGCGIDDEKLRDKENREWVERHKIKIE